MRVEIAPCSIRLLAGCLALATAVLGTRAWAAERVLFYHNDAVGSPVAMTDSTGAVVWRADYEPFGGVVEESGTASTTHRFTGKERDVETGLDYFGARYLSGPQARFTSPDPSSPLMQAFGSNDVSVYLANPQHWNRYAYGLNNPLRYVDPNGEWAVLIQAAQRLAPYVDKAARATQRYGRQVYVWATRFFNSPTAQEAATTVSETVTGAQLPGGLVPQLPLGFPSTQAFQEFGTGLLSGLRAAGFDDATALFQGSSVTGRNAVTGAPFDSVKVSDFDIALVGQSLLDRARKLGIALRSGGARTGPLSDAEIHKLGLGELRSRLSQQAGRPVNFMIFGTEEQALRRGPSIPVR